MKTIESEADARLKVVLTEVVNSIETLMLSGLTSVSPSITDKFQNAFEQAAKCKQLRLSSNLRIVNEELKRFFEDDKRFSEKRFSLFLNRCWQLSRYILQPNTQNDGYGQSDTRHVETLKVSIHGVIKKTVPGVFSALEFRLRNLDQLDNNNKPLVWSCILATPENSKVTPEAMLTLEQPQEFTPSVFLTSTVTLLNIDLVEDDTNIRIQMNKQSRVVSDNQIPPSIENPQDWSLTNLPSAIRNVEHTPLDLETQPQYEIYLQNVRPGKEFTHPVLDRKVLFPLNASGKQLYLAIENTDDGQGQLNYFRTSYNTGAAEDDLLFGLLHYEQGICLFQPLTMWQKGHTPKHLMITEDHSDYAALLKILK